MSCLSCSRIAFETGIFLRAIEGDGYLGMRRRDDEAI